MSATHGISWSVTCKICGAEIESHESYGDSKAMLRNHIAYVHPATPEGGAA